MNWREVDEFEEREYRRGRAPGFGYVRASGELLAPADYRSERRRSRSQGAQAPVPNISIYNSTRAEADSRSPSPMRGRQNELIGRLADAEYRLGRERSRGRDEARTEVIRTEIRNEPRNDALDNYYRDMQMQLALTEERYRREALEGRLGDLQRQYGDQRRHDEDRLATAEERWRQLEETRLRDATWQDKAEREEELWRKKSELRRLKDRIEATESDARFTSKLELEELKREQKMREAELKRKEDREKVLAEREKQEREAKEERKRIKLEIEAKEREEEDERKRMIAEYQQKEAEKKKQQEDAAAKAIADYEKKKADEKRKEEELKAKFRAEEEEEKRKKKEEREAWKLKIEAEEHEEKEKKKKQEKEMEEEMRRKMAKYGFQDNQIEAVLHPRRADKLPAGALPDRPLVTSTAVTTTTAYRPPPTYVKIHRDHIDIETLRYFGLPWEYDTDREYIIITQELDAHETDLLFEHTRKLRHSSTTLTIEDRGRGHDGRPEYAFVRRRSKSRRGHSPVPILRLV